MIPITFIGQTHTYIAPRNWDTAANGPCGDLPVKRDEAAQTCMSVWQPSAEERAAIAAGAAVALTVCGEQPPVSLGIHQ